MKLLRTSTVANSTIAQTLASMRGELYANAGSFANYSFLLVCAESGKTLAESQNPSLTMFKSAEHEKGLEDTANATADLASGTEYAYALVPNYAVTGVLAGTYTCEDIGIVSAVPAENRTLSEMISAEVSAVSVS